MLQPIPIFVCSWAPYLSNNTVFACVLDSSTCSLSAIPACHTPSAVSPPRLTQLSSTQPAPPPPGLPNPSPCLNLTFIYNKLPRNCNLVPQKRREKRLNKKRGHGKMRNGENEDGNEKRNYNKMETKTNKPKKQMFLLQKMKTVTDAPLLLCLFIDSTQRCQQPGSW